MTRIDSVRHAADVTKDSVRHAAEVAAPYANTARESAVQYAHQTSALARQSYEDRLADRIGQARGQARAAVSTAMPTKAAAAMETAAKRTKETARTAADYTAPRVGAAVSAARTAADYTAPRVGAAVSAARTAADYTAPRVGAAVSVTRSVAGPARDEAVMRGAAALQALRGQVSAADIDRLVRRRTRRRRGGRIFVGLVAVGLAGGAALAAYKWWSRQANPDWLVEPTEPTESPEKTGGGTLTIVDPLDAAGVAEATGQADNASLNGSAPRVDRADGSPEAAGLDPEVEAKQADADDKKADGPEGHEHGQGDSHS